MKKKKLSEVSIDAAKLNGQAPSFYNFRTFGLGTMTNDTTPYVSNFNNDLNTGFYTASANADNSPVSEACNLLHIKRAAGYAYQLAFSVNISAKVYYRVLSASNWSEWREM